jgi:hypothetical protein
MPWSQAAFQNPYQSVYWNTITHRFAHYMDWAGDNCKLWLGMGVALSWDTTAHEQRTFAHKETNKKKQRDVK